MRHTRRLFSWITALAMTLALLPGPVQAADEDESQNPASSVTIWGNKINNGNYLYYDADGRWTINSSLPQSYNSDKGSAHLENGTLTLNGLDISASDFDMISLGITLLTANGDLQIELIGENKLSTGGKEVQGVSIDGDCTIAVSETTNTGTLDLTVSSDMYYTNFDCSGDLTINEGVTLILTEQAGGYNRSAVGISADNITINGADVSVTCGNNALGANGNITIGGSSIVNIPKASTALSVSDTNGTITIKDSAEVTIKPVDATMENEIAAGVSLSDSQSMTVQNSAKLSITANTSISASGTSIVTISDAAEVTTEGSTSNSIQMQDSSQLRMSGSKLTATGPSYGIQLKDSTSMEVTGGTVTAESTSTSSNSRGIYLTNSASLSVTDGTVEAKSNGSGISISGNTASSAQATMTVSGGEVTATGNGSYNNHGIYLDSGGSLTVDGGMVTANGNGSSSSHGIYLDSNSSLTVNNGEVTANTTGSTNSNGISLGSIGSPVDAGL